MEQIWCLPTYDLSLSCNLMEKYMFVFPGFCDVEVVTTMKVIYKSSLPLGVEL